MEIVYGIIGLILGGGVSYFLMKQGTLGNFRNMVEDANRKADATVQAANLTAKRIGEEAELKAERLVDKAEKKNEAVKQQKIQEAREKFNQLRSEFDIERSKSRSEMDAEKANHLLQLKEREVGTVAKEAELKQRLIAAQKDFDEIEKRQNQVAQKEEDLKTLRDNLDKQLQIVNKKSEELDKVNEERLRELERVANLTQTEAKEQILAAVRAKSENEAMVIMKNSIEQAQTNANREAKKIVIQAIQRMSAEFAIENTVSVFNLDNDELKGQIIGREGRNIRALEAATGAEIVVDDTPEAIVISSFDPIRREIARLALKKLVTDGRIHPARIEEVVVKVKKQLDEQIVEIGERTVIDLDIHGLSAELVRMVGRMRYRSSYGQNLLKHSIETANLCALMAAELGLSSKLVKLAKRAGLLHDIGKVSDEESELSHALLGMKFCEKANEHPAVINAVGAHHDEIEMNNIISPIVQACDAISGARPGARREILESYLKRIGELEHLALAYDGVQKAYAMQAGRELRVIVESEKVTDEFADELSFMISQKIQNEMQYPGQIKVTVIREKRAVTFAR